VTRTRLHDTVTRTITQQVVDRDYEVGQWLPRELDLAARHNVSRGVAKEAIQALQERGLIMVRHGRGARVEPEAEWNVLDAVVLRALVTADDRPDVLEQLIECRRIVAPPAAALAAQRATAADVDRLALAFRAIQDAPTTRRPTDAEEHPFVQAEIAFQRTLASIVGNRPLAKMLEPLDTALAIACHERAPDRRPAVIKQHAKVNAAIAAHEPEAAREAVEESVDLLGRWLLKRRRS
jgi:DNA-binding FadR family transcriptional regulator